MKRKAGVEPPYRGAPDVGAVLKRLRKQRGVSIRAVAEGSGLSPSFISALERGQTDVSIGSVARIANFFNYDVGAMLGYSSQIARPAFIRPSDRLKRHRGRGIAFEVVRLPGMNLDVNLMSFAPRAAYKDVLVHDGVEALLVTAGELVLMVDGVDYLLRNGECAVYSAAYPHTIRNDSSKEAAAIGMTTGRM